MTCRSSSHSYQYFVCSGLTSGPRRFPPKLFSQSSHSSSSFPPAKTISDLFPISVFPRIRFMQEKDPISATSDKMSSGSRSSKRPLAFVSRFISESESKRLKASEPDAQLLLNRSLPGEIVEIAPESTRFVTSLPSWDDRVIDERALARQIPLSHIQQQAPLAGLGQLNKLSGELVQMVVDELDIQSLTTLRSVNRCTSLFATNHISYQRLLRVAPNLLRAYLATGLASWFKPSQLLEPLDKQDCVFCGEFGGFLYRKLGIRNALSMKPMRLRLMQYDKLTQKPQVPKCIRSCFRCLAHDRRTLTITIGEAIHRLGLSADDLSNIPTMYTIPRSNFWGRPQVAQRTALVDYNAAAALTSASDNVQDHGDLSSSVHSSTLPGLMQKRMHQRTRFDAKNGSSSCEGNHVYNGCTINAAEQSMLSPPGVSTDAGPGVLRLPKHIFGAEGTATSQRFLASMRLPVLRTASGHFDYGVYCNGCKNSNIISGVHPIEHKMYSQTGIVVHLLRCPFARAMWRNARSNPWVVALGFFPSNLAVRGIRQGPLPPELLLPHYGNFFDKYSWAPSISPDLIKLYFEYEAGEVKRSQAIKHRKLGQGVRFAGQEMTPVVQHMPSASSG